MLQTSLKLLYNCAALVENDAFSKCSLSLFAGAAREFSEPSMAQLSRVASLLSSSEKASMETSVSNRAQYGDIYMIQNIARVLLQQGTLTFRGTAVFTTL